MIQIKQTKNIDYFIAILLPYLENYLNENQTHCILIYANEYICKLLNIMFSNNVQTQQIKNGYDVINTPAIELDIFLGDMYDIHTNLKISKPLYRGENKFLKSKAYICIYAKCILSEPFNNMTHDMIEKLIKNTNMNKYEIFLVGNQMECVNTRYGKIIDSFADTLDYLRYCKLFITSFSMWQYISALCNSRNILIYNTSPHIGIEYHPFNNNVISVKDLQNTETYKLVNSILDK